MKKRSLFTLVLINCIFLSFTMYNGETNYWEILEKVKTKSTFNPETEEFSVKYKFSKKIKKLEGKTIQLKGFVLPYSNDELILSRFESHFSCCGGFNLTNTVECELTHSMKDYLGKSVVLEGVLKLNTADPFRRIYILENAKCLNCQ